MSRFVTRKFYARSSVAIALAAIYSGSPVHAVEVTWLGGSGNWSTAAAWSFGVVPDGAAFDVLIDGGNGLVSAVTLTGTPRTIGRLTIDAMDSLTIGNGGFLTLAGGSVVNRGTLLLSSSGSSTRLQLAADTLFSGSGTTVLGNSANNHIYGAHTLTIGSGHTFSGGGQVGSTSFGALTRLVNNGTLRADASGGMSVSASTFNNSQGLVQVTDGSSFVLQSGTTLTGGTINGDGTAHLSGAGTFRDTTLTGTLRIANANTFSAAGTLTNNGSFTVASTGSSTRFLLTGDLTLTGSGSTTVGNSQNNHIYGPHTLTIASGHTLNGGGQVGSTSFGALTRLVNNGSLRADASGGMSVSAGTFDNSQGLVQVTDGSSFVLQSGTTLTGGTINGDGTAHLSGAGIFSATTLTGTLRVSNGNTFNAAGTLTNNGSFAIASTGSATRLVLTGGLTLTGTGSTTIGNSQNNHISGSHTLIIASGHTLNGGGQVGSTSFGALTSLVNEGTLRADANTGMSIWAGGFDNRQGLVQVFDASSLVLQGGTTLSGGTINGNGTAHLSGGGTFSNTTLTGTLRVANGNIFSAAGTLTNDGSFAISSTGSATRLALTGNLTLTGTGSTTISNSQNNHVYGAHTLTIASGHTLSGGGQVGSTSFGALTGLVNNGTLQANASTGMSVSAGTFDNSQGLVRVADASFVNLQSNTTLSGGTINGAGTAYLTGTGIYKDATLTGTLRVNNGDIFNAAGTLTNNGSFTIAGAGSATRLVLADDLTLTGSGSTTISNSQNNHIYGARTLTIASGHTLSGGGQVGSTSFGALTGLVNNGTLRADTSSGMSVLAGTVNNSQGQIRVLDGSFFVLQGGSDLSGGTIEGTSTAYLSGAGTYLNTNLKGTLGLQGGTFRDVTVTGSATVTNAGNINAAGTLTNNGSFVIASSGSATRLALTGDLTLTGTGSTTIGNSQNNHISGSNTLTIANGHTLSGGGQVGSTSFGALTSLVNQGTLRAGATTGMSVLATTVDNRTGTFSVASNTTLSVNGNLLLSDLSLLQIDVAGLTQGTQHGLLRLSQNTVFDGVVLLDFGSFAAQIGDSFTFLTLAGSALGTGSFDNVLGTSGYELSVSYFNNRVVATVTAVPEPQTWALLIAGIGFLAWRLRQRAQV